MQCYDRSQFINGFRPDGWPLCPQCEEDELYSRYTPDRRAIDGGPEDAILQLYLTNGVKCYLCGWQSKEWA